MKKLTKIQQFGKQLEGFLVETYEEEIKAGTLYTVVITNEELILKVSQLNNEKDYTVTMGHKTGVKEGFSIKTQKEILEVFKLYIDRQVKAEEVTEGYIVKNGESLADVANIPAEDLVGKKIKYTAYYADGSKSTSEELEIKRIELKIFSLPMNKELVCYNKKTGNTSFMKYTEKLNSKRIKKWIFTIIEAEKEVEFKPENTAIDTNQSHTAKMVVENIVIGDKILDYGCGTGRNMRYIKNNARATVEIEGCDIADQLVRNAHKHEELKNKGMNVFEDVKTPKEKYNIVLNSHVLNVIPSDKIKQQVINNIYDALVDGGRAMIEVRTKSDVEGAKYKVPFGDGWHMTKTNTYQESLTKEKMQRLAINAGFVIEEHFCKSTRHYMVLRKIQQNAAIA